MKRFSFFLSLAIGLFAAAFAFQSCQKEQLASTNGTTSNIPSTNRAAEVYGVSVFSAGNPSKLITMDAGNGAILNSIPVYFFNSTGQQIFLDDLKGVCTVNGQVWLTSGFHPIDAYSNLLLKADPHTGFASIIAHSSIGTVSDIDYDPNTDLVYGLLNNSNRLVTITNNSIFTVVGNIVNMGGYVAKGLTMVREGGNNTIVVAGTLATGGNARVYSVPAIAGAANFLANINPANELAAAHCGIGFDLDLNAVLINRRASAGFGLNSFAWANPLANPTNSAFWGGNGVNFEDLSSDVQ